MAVASRRAQIADAVVTALNGSEFDQKFTAGRKYVPLLSLDALGLAGFTVTVWIGEERRQMYSRAKSRKDLDIHIGIESRIQPTTKPESASPADYQEIDDYMAVAEQIADFLEPFGPPSTKSAHLAGTGATWAKTQVNGPYSAKVLFEERVFASGLVITYAYV